MDSDKLGLVKLNSMIKTISVKEKASSKKDKLKSKVSKLAMKARKGVTKRKTQEFSKLKMKHLSSMTEKWKKLRMKVKMGARL